MKRTLVLGATSSIAHETARIWASRKDSLYLVGRNAERLEAVAADLRVRGASRVETEVRDLTDLEAHDGIVRRAEEALGGLDRALLAHGTLGDQALSQEDFTEAEKELRNNFLSAASLLTHLANRFETKKAGSIVVISSVAGDRGRQSNYVYGSAKAAVSAFTSGLRNRLQKSGVSVLTVKPGFVDTPMTAHVPKNPLFARPEAVARGIVRAEDRRRDVVYLPGFWRLIMLAVRMLPERIFKKLSL